MTIDNTNAFNRDQLLETTSGQATTGFLLSDSLNRSDALSIIRLGDLRAKQSGNTGLHDLPISGQPPIPETWVAQLPTKGDGKTATDATTPPKNSDIVDKTQTAITAAKAAHAAKKEIPALPANPSGGVVEFLPGGSALKVATPGGIAEVHQKAANMVQPINDALSGKPKSSGDWSYMGSVTRPTRNMIGWASTPDVTLNVNGKDVKLEIPPIGAGKTVTFYNNGHQVEARSGDKKWELIYGYNKVSSVFDDGFKWREK